MLGGVKEANYFIAFEITLMQLYHAHSCDIIVINTRPLAALPQTHVITVILA